MRIDMGKKGSQLSKKGENAVGEPKKTPRRIVIDIFVCIVLISFLVSFMPRTYSPKSKSKDVVRRNDLHQIETAIKDYKYINGVWPNLDRAKNGTTISSMKKELKRLGISRRQLRDPNKQNEVYGLGTIRENGEYLYIVTKKDGVENGGFVLMAKTDVEGLTNWIVCKDGSGLEQGYITNDTDINDIKLCDERVDKSDTCSPSDCKYKNFNDELRYIVID